MTIERSVLPSSGPSTHFPERPRRTDMQNALYRERPGHQTALIRHFGDPDTTLVIADVPVGWSVSRQQGILYPDMMIAFDVDCASVILRRGFAIDEQGKPPDFVLEIASVSTALNDYTGKREGYAAYGIPEYWRFDPTGGDRYPVGLAGDRLVGKEYQPMEIVPTEEGSYWGHSDVLNLDLCWEHGQLRFYDPVAQLYLLTHDEEAQARITAEAERITAFRDSAEAQRDAERQAHIGTEAEYQARIRELEEELRRHSQ